MYAATYIEASLDSCMPAIRGHDDERDFLRTVPETRKESTLSELAVRLGYERVLQACLHVVRQRVVFQTLHAGLAVLERLIFATSRCRYHS